MEICYWRLNLTSRVMVFFCFFQCLPQFILHLACRDKGGYYKTLTEKEFEGVVKAFVEKFF